MRYNPFPKVNSSRGSPMGRFGDNPTNLQDLKTLFSRHQGGGGGYDSGGAYWGLPSNVWAVWGRVDGSAVVTYVRAGSREGAIRLVREFV